MCYPTDFEDMEYEFLEAIDFRLFVCNETVWSLSRNVMYGAISMLQCTVLVDGSADAPICAKQPRYP